MPKHYLKSQIGIIGGGNLSNLDILKKAKLKSFSTPYGKIFYYLTGNHPLILRHSLRENIPPHQVNYRANIFAFKKMGIRYIFSFNSVGSLKKEIKPGEFLIPHDYIDFNPLTFYDQDASFITPEISSKARAFLIKILKKLKFKFQTQGIYFVAKGPRLETKAEINLIKNFAEVVGMTMAKEATLAQELNLEYASLCSVDNYAHGLIEKSLSEGEIRKSQLKIKKKINKIIREILKLGGVIYE